MERNRNTPQLRFPEFEENWERKKLGDLLEFKNGINATKEQYGRGVKFINVLDILNNDFITHDKIIGSVDVDPKIADTYSVRYGDILFQRSSETREEVGSANVYLDEENAATFGGFVIRGRKIGDYEPSFLNKLLKTNTARDEITSKSGGSTRYNVGQETLSSVVLLFPNLTEQTKIASFLIAIDRRMTILTQQKKNLEQYKNGVMQKLFNQELRFKDENGNEFPEWGNTNFGSLYSFTSTNSLSREKLNYEIGDVRNIHYGDIHTKFRSHFNISREFVPFINSDIDLSKIPKEYYLQEGDLVIVDASEDYSDIGKSIEIVNLNGEKVLAGLHTILARRKNKEIIVGFAAHLLKNWTTRLEIMRIAQGTKVLSISSKRLELIPLKIPCPEEQQKIATFLSSLDAKIEKIAEQIEKTKIFKQGLLQKMFV